MQTGKRMCPRCLPGVADIAEHTVFDRRHSLSIMLHIAVFDSDSFVGFGKHAAGEPIWLPRFIVTKANTVDFDRPPDPLDPIG